VHAPAWLTQTPIAHRGLHSPGVPENSLAAIEAAVAAGLPVEIDIQPTADGRVVCFHDWNLQRMTGRDGRVAATKSGELSDLRLLGTGEGIPFFEDVLRLVAGRQPLVIEIKNRRQPEGMEAAMSAILKDYQGAYVVHSFNPFSLGWLRRNAPWIVRGQISCAFDTDDMATWKKLLLEHYAMNWMSRPHFISHQIKRLPSPVTSVLRNAFGLPLLAWTAKSPEEFALAKTLADNVIFEGFPPPKF
jgi:glycerophosphoryl diester phosphodiesterase